MAAAGVGVFAVAPISAVLSGAANIGGDVATLRLNGADREASIADQGAGNYGNYPLFIGARAGTSLWFNGRLYSLVIRGAQSTTQKIEQTEAWVNGKTRAYQ